MFIRLLLLAGLICLGVVAPVHARLIEDWSYERLLSTADIVVIGTVVGTKEWNEPMTLPLFADALEGTLTTFKVEGVLKGKAAGDKIELIHCCLKEGKSVVNGPLLAEFRSKGRTLQIEAVDGVQEKRNEQEGTPQYLLFLKARSDGRYEPVAGQVDSALSVRRLNEEK